MHVIRAHFDGKQIVMPSEASGLAPGEVIVIFENGSVTDREAQAWSGASETAFARVWENDEDSVYDSM